MDQQTQTSSSRTPEGFSSAMGEYRRSGKPESALRVRDAIRKMTTADKRHMLANYEQAQRAEGQVAPQDSGSEQSGHDLATSNLVLARRRPTDLGQSHTEGSVVTSNAPKLEPEISAATVEDTSHGVDGAQPEISQDPEVSTEMKDQQSGTLVGFEEIGADGEPQTIERPDDSDTSTFDEPNAASVVPPVAGDNVSRAQAAVGGAPIAEQGKATETETAIASDEGTPTETPVVTVDKTPNPTIAAQTSGTPEEPRAQKTAQTDTPALSPEDDERYRVPIRRPEPQKAPEDPLTIYPANEQMQPASPDVGDEDVSVDPRDAIKERIKNGSDKLDDELSASREESSTSIAPAPAEPSVQTTPPTADDRQNSKQEAIGEIKQDKKTGQPIVAQSRSQGLHRMATEMSRRGDRINSADLNSLLIQDKVDVGAAVDNPIEIRKEAA